MDVYSIDKNKCPSKLGYIFRLQKMKDQASMHILKTIIFRWYNYTGQRDRENQILSMLMQH